MCTAAFQHGTGRFLSIAVETSGISTICDFLGRRLVQEETLEKALALPLRSVSKFHPDVDAARMTQCRIEAFNMVCRHEHEVALGGSNPVKVQKSAQR